MRTEAELALMRERQEEDEMIAKFLQEKANVNTDDQWTQPFMSIAARRSSPRLMSTFLKHGGNPNIVDPYDHAIYDEPVDFWIVTGSQPSLYRKTIDWDKVIYEPGNPPLLEAAQEMGDELDSNWGPAQNEDVLECMRLLLEYGADVDGAGYEGRTALILMVQRAFPDAVRLLLAHGANPTIQDAKGKNAFDYAKQPAEYDSAEQRKAEIRQMLT